MEWLEKLFGITAGLIFLIIVACLLVSFLNSAERALGRLFGPDPKPYRPDEAWQAIRDDLDALDDLDAGNDESTRRAIRRLKRRLHRLEQALEEQGRH